MIQPVLWMTGEAPGAYPNETRIVKVMSEPGDSHTNGAQGKVVGSLGPVTKDMLEGVPGMPQEMIGGYLYWVMWDDMPGVGVGVGGYKIAAVAS